MPNHLEKAHKKNMKGNKSMRRGKMMAMQKQRILSNPKFLALLGGHATNPATVMETSDEGFNYSGFITGASVSVISMAVAFYALKKCERKSSSTDDYTKPLL